MPKKYLTQNSIKFLAAMMVCLLLVFFNPRGFFDPVRSIFLEIAYPFQKTFYLASRSIAGTFEFLGSISELKKENEKLIKENNYQSAEIAILKKEKSENAMLREQLGLIPKDKFDLEASFIIGRDLQRLGSWVLIDKGDSSGIKKDMPVIVNNSMIIGRVSETENGISKVSLLSDSESAVNVMDLETGAKGIIRGEYGLGIMMDMISQEDIINAGDTIITSGLGSDMPKGLLAGKVREVSLSEDKLFQRAIITPAAKYSKLDIVFIIKK